MTSLPPEEASPGVVAVLVPEGDDVTDYFEAVKHGSGVPVAVGYDDIIPSGAGALLVIGTASFGGDVPPILASAIEQDVPVLGIGWGMHAINVALGGESPVVVPGATGETVKMPVFISPGAKLSYTIAGSGWVSVPFSNTEGIRPADLASGLMGSCFREDGFIAAFEIPGRNWVLGVQWNAHEINSLPSGFDSLLLALVERAAGEQ